MQQLLPNDPNGTAPYFVSLFDPERNIPFYSAYKVTPQQAPFIGTYKRRDVKGDWRNPPGMSMAYVLYEGAPAGIMGVVFNKTYGRLGNAEYNYQARLIGGNGHCK